MTSRERFMKAIRNEVPDRVPVTPDLSNYIPCRRTGLPFWEIYFEQHVPLWRAYLDAADYFGIDLWIAASLDAPLWIFEDPTCETETHLQHDQNRNAMIRQTVMHTPQGDLEMEETCFHQEPPTINRKPIRNLERDWPRFKCTQRMPKEMDMNVLREVRSECEKRQQPFGLGWTYPGFHMWNLFVANGIETLTFAEIDMPQILQEWFELDLAIGTQAMELMLDVHPDYICFGGSGTLTLASPELASKYAMPALARWSDMAVKADVPTMLHSCGKSRKLVDMLIKHTQIDCINPLEIPPMGDVDLAEVKQACGDRIALMGNLHTTNVMLEGSPQQVRDAARDAIRAAGSNGGFILSTGDQCGLHTPDENIFAMVEAARTYGQYDPDGKICTPKT